MSLKIANTWTTKTKQTYSLHIFVLRFEVIVVNIVLQQALCVKTNPKNSKSWKSIWTGGFSCVIGTGFYRTGFSKKYKLRIKIKINQNNVYFLTVVRFFVYEYKIYYIVKISLFTEPTVKIQTLKSATAPVGRFSTLLDRYGSFCTIRFARYIN